MLASIAVFQFADGTLAGGVALSDFKMRVQRVYDVVIPLRQADPVPIDRILRKFDLTFTVKRCHASIKASEQYIQDHETTVPQTGDVNLFTTRGTQYTLENGAVLSHELIQEIGSTTFHSYHVIGGPFGGGIAPPAFFILMETSGDILLESGGKIGLE
jgi:hypothetical protein